MITHSDMPCVQFTLHLLHCSVSVCVCVVDEASHVRLIHAGIALNIDLHLRRRSASHLETFNHLG